MGVQGRVNDTNAIAGVSGQRQWTDYKPDGDFSEAILNNFSIGTVSVEAFTFATGNDVLELYFNAFNHLLTNTAQIFADARTFIGVRIAIERVTGKKLEGWRQTVSFT